MFGCFSDTTTEIFFYRLDGYLYGIRFCRSLKGAERRKSARTNKKKKKVTIPESITVQGVEYDVTSIGEKAFSNCKKLTLLEIKTKKLTKKTVAKKTFKSIRKKTVIKVPKSKYKAYKKVLRARGLNKKVKIKK